MGNKIFVSYKYGDDRINNLCPSVNSTVRDYVNKFEGKIDSSNHIYKGEHDNEDLSQLSDEAIWEELKDKIYDSSVTIVFISPGMREDNKTDRNQWIPWEISYSLKETSRKTETGKNITSRTNAMIGVVLPDEQNSYDYYLESKTCCESGCVTHHTGKMFDILKKNKFNYKNPTKRGCDNNAEKIWLGECSYIGAVRWNDFINNIDYYIEKAHERLNDIDNYDIHKEL